VRLVTCFSQLHGKTDSLFFYHRCAVGHSDLRLQRPSSMDLAQQKISHFILARNPTNCLANGIQFFLDWEAE
jgi:hypothetical protein